MSTILCFSVNMGCYVYINEEKKMNLNDFSKWLQYNRVKNLRGSEYFPYPLYIYIKPWYDIFSISPTANLLCHKNNVNLRYFVTTGMRTLEKQTPFGLL